MQRQQTALTEVIGLTRAVDLLLVLVGSTLAAGVVQERLEILLVDVWTERWRKAVNKKSRQHPPKTRGREHTSVHCSWTNAAAKNKHPLAVVDSL